MKAVNYFFRKLHLNVQLGSKYAPGTTSEVCSKLKIETSEGFLPVCSGVFDLKGCVRYIFASLFCMSKREHL